MTKERFEEIMERLNDVKPNHISWGCGNEFGGYGSEREIEGLDGAVIPLVYAQEVFGFCHKRNVYYRTNDLNALNVAKLFARQSYTVLQEM